MKVVVESLVYGICIAVVGAFNQAALSLEDITEFLKYNNECRMQSGVTTPELMDLVRGSFSDSQSLKDHIFCMAIKLRLVSSDGHFQRSEISQKIAPLFQQTPDVFESLMERCDMKRETPTDIVYESLKCFAESIKEGNGSDFVV